MLKIKGRPCLHMVYVDGVSCLHIVYVDAVSFLHMDSGSAGEATLEEFTQ